MVLLETNWNNELITGKSTSNSLLARSLFTSLCRSCETLEDQMESERNHLQQASNELELELRRIRGENHKLVEENESLIRAHSEESRENFPKPIATTFRDEEVRLADDAARLREEK